ncbi:GGDEF domain-containing protein [Methylobacterium oxalidis]|uniref:GGDEF domain-containing protein n=1 Tax=Methylobacterium oxalidis TaxID=944322 RepID=UPI0033154ACA
MSAWIAAQAVEHWLPPDLEARYRARVRPRRDALIRLWLLLVASVNVLCIPVDAMNLEDHLGTILVARLVFGAGILLGVRALLGRPRPDWLAALGVIAATLTITLVTGFLGHLRSTEVGLTYDLSAPFAVFSALIWLPVGVRTAAAMLVLNQAAFGLLIWRLDVALTTKLSILIYYPAVMLAATVMHRFVEITRRTDFLRDLLGAAQQRELAEANLRLEEHVRRDPLTGLGNRRAFEEALRAARGPEDAGSGGDLAVLILDVDHFKLYNDRYGHQGGDACLRAVAECLSAEVRAPVRLARYGGEEFVLVAPGLGPREAGRLGERLRAAVEAAAIPHAAHALGRVTISVGFAADGPGGRLTGRELTERADLALYAAKRAGRNLCRGYEPPAAGPLHRAA